MQGDRYARSLLYDISLNWTCNLTDLNRSLTCVDRSCNNGDCEKTVADTGLCRCYPGWRGWQCSMCCDLPCENDGVCETIDDDGNNTTPELQYCNCYWSNHTGPLCEVERNFTDPAMNVNWTKNIQHMTIEWEIAFIVSVILFVILGSAVFCALYYMYRTRHPFLVRQLVRYHEKFIDDSGRYFDVFISYVSGRDEDRRFAVKLLLPFLEQQGYTVCVADRNVRIGTAQVDSIVEAIESSKRTILVLSPAFLAEEWKEFEVQRALMESLKKQHRIIPLIFRPLGGASTQLSPTLRHVMEAITVLEWPGEGEDGERRTARFWRCMRAALPKQAAQEGQEGAGEGGEGRGKFWRRMRAVLTKQTKQASQEKEGGKERVREGEEGKRGRFWRYMRAALPKHTKQTSQEEEDCGKEGAREAEGGAVEDKHEHSLQSTSSQSSTHMLIGDTRHKHSHKQSAAAGESKMSALFSSLAFTNFQFFKPRLYMHRGLSTDSSGSDSPVFTVGGSEQEGESGQKRKTSSEGSSSNCKAGQISLELPKLEFEPEPARLNAQYLEKLGEAPDEHCA